MMEVEGCTEGDQFFTGNGFGEIADEEDSVGFAFYILHERMFRLLPFSSVEVYSSPHRKQREESGESLVIRIRLGEELFGVVCGWFVE